LEYRIQATIENVQWTAATAITPMQIFETLITKSDLLPTPATLALRKVGWPFSRSHTKPRLD
jgi:hypothetical protein